MRREPHPRMKPETVKARDARYEFAKFKEVDMLQLLGTVNLTQEEWDAWDSDKKRLLIEFISNVYAEDYGDHVPLSESEDTVEKNKAIVRDAFQKITEQLRLLTELSTEADEIDKALMNNRGDSRAIERATVIENMVREQLENLQRAHKNLVAVMRRASASFNTPGHVDRMNSILQLCRNDLSTGRITADQISTYPPFIEYRNTLEEIMTPFFGMENDVNRRHDWIHRAEDLANGKNKRYFKASDRRTITLSQEMNLAEHYPSLFLMASYTNNEGRHIPINLAMALRTPEFRQQVALTDYRAMQDQRNQQGYVAKAYRDNTRMLLGPMPTTAQERQYEYERYLRNIEVYQAAMRVPDISEADLRYIDDIFDDMPFNGTRPQRYAAFAKRAFSDEPKKDPYFWANELAALVAEAERVATGQQAPRFNS